MDANDNTFGQAEPIDPGTEDLLWQLSTLRSLADSESHGPPIEEDEIDRYRSGEMPATERRRFEQRLALDEHGLERLARVVTRPPARPPSSWRLAASIALGTLATAGLFFSLQDGSDDDAAFELPSYTVTVQGLSERRGLGSTSYETRPGSTVRIVARPATKPAPNLEFAVYRHGNAGLLELIPQGTARIEVVRGTAVLQAEATALVGDEPGLHELVLLIGPEGFAPPASFEEGAVDALARAGGLRIYTFELRLLPPDGGDRVGASAACNSRPTQSRATVARAL